MIYQFEKFQLDTDKRQLSIKNTLIPVSSKAYEILLYLIENRSKTISKTELLDKVWVDSFVEEANLPVYISALRKIFKQYDKENDYIKTVSGKGYVFTGFVEEITVDTFSSNAVLENLPTKDSEAHHFYVKGKYILETSSTRFKLEEDFNQAIDFFNAAIRLKPDYGEAYLGICRTIILLNDFDFITFKEAYSRSKTILRQASFINSQSSEFVLLEGLIAMNFELNATKARDLLLKAVKLDEKNAEAHYSMGIISLCLGNMDDASKYYSNARRLNPLNMKHHNGMIRRYYYAGEFNKAIVKAKEAIEMDNRSYAAHYLLSGCYAELGIYDEALKCIDEVAENFYLLEFEFKRAYILAKINQPEYADKLIAEVMTDENKLRGNVLSIVAIYAVQNKLDEAFDLLFQYHSDSTTTMITLKVDPRLKNLRSDERFQILLEKMNLI